MKKIIFLSATVVLLISISVFSCTESKTTEPKTEVKQEMSQEALIKRGEYIVLTAACDDCHSPKLGNSFEIDPERRLSGYPSNVPVKTTNTPALKDGYLLFGPGLNSAIGPWRMSFAANLTSDSTGIGAWTEEQFFNAIRHGKSKGLMNNRDLLPPMPWPVYKNLTDEDLRAVFAFLKSTKPVRNIVPAPIPPDQLK